MAYIIVSAYTSNTPYEQEVKRLEKNIIKFNLPYKLHPYKSTGDWSKNTHIKAQAILTSLLQQDKDVVWIDADASLVKNPVFFDDLDCDMSCHFLNSRWDPHELISGTLFFKNNDKAKKIVGDWINLNSTNKEWDQKNLQKIVGADKELKIIPLPQEYIKIDGLGKQQPNMKDPFIVHHQASRKLRNGKLL